MKNLFLKAKHWQLFLLTFGIPIFFQLFMMGFIVSSMSEELNPGPEMFFNYFKFIPLVTLVFAGVFFGWFWSVATGLQKKIPTTVKMKVNRFKVFFFIPLVYILFITLFMVFSINGLITQGAKVNSVLIGSFIAIIIPLHLFSMFCIFHTLYFVAKTFKTVELQQEVRFSDFAGEFFMIWFFPIGIWIVQPKINKMTEE